eukprot:Skav227532  [mRNA]  locus=scaffold3314:47557:68952:+ [translate_table: standard]
MDAVLSSRAWAGTMATLGLNPVDSEVSQGHEGYSGPEQGSFEGRPWVQICAPLLDDAEEQQLPVAMTDEFFMYKYKIHWCPVGVQHEWHNCDHYEVRQMFALDWQENSIADGEFTVPDDREVVVQLGKRAVNSDVGLIRALAENRADVNHRVKDLAELGYFDGQTLLMVAAKTRQKLGIGHSPLHHAAVFSRGNPWALESDHRADVNAEAQPSGRVRWFTLAAQAYVGLMGEVRSPISYRAFAHIPKATPLLEAAWTGDTQLVKLLLEAKADLKPNEFGHLPEDLARSNGHFHLLPILSVFSV